MSAKVNNYQSYGIQEAGRSERNTSADGLFMSVPDSLTATRCRLAEAVLSNRAGEAKLVGLAMKLLSADKVWTPKVLSFWPWFGNALVEDEPLEPGTSVRFGAQRIAH